MKNKQTKTFITIVFIITIFLISNNYVLSQICEPYLGQTPPENVVTLFPPENLQANSIWFWHGVPTFSPDGMEMYFVKYMTNINKTEIWFTKCIDNVWTEPQKAPFSNTTYSDNNPFFKSADTLFFHSVRYSQAFIFRVTRSSGGVWSAPVPVILQIPAGYGVGLQFSIAKNGNIYSELSQNGNDNIYVWKFENNHYLFPEKLTDICTSHYEGFPYIDKNERFILFCSDRIENSNALDIYISFKNINNSWTDPVNLSLGNIITDGYGWSNISTDGSYLFFTKSDEFGANPYWVDAQYIYDMIPKTPYLGQTPPGFTPEKFAPTIISTPTTTEWSCTFSPDSLEMYFYRISQKSNSILYICKFEAGAWTLPTEVDFTAAHSTSEPYLTLDNQRLYFAWDDAGIYMVERTGKGWSTPVFAGQGMWLSSKSGGQLYTTDMSSLFTTGKTYLAKITSNNGLFTDYERMSFQPNYGYQAHPCIAHDGSFMIFDVDGGKHLFVSFKKPDGSWDIAIDLSTHGFDVNAGGAYLSPEGKYLFFHLNGDIWWVDAAIINNLNPYSGINGPSNSSSKEILFFHNNPNPCSTQTTIAFELNKSMKLSIEIKNIAGIKVMEVVNNHTYQKGKHEMLVDVSTLASGIYTYTLSSEKGEQWVKKMMIIK